MKSVVVIGGGITGLTAMHELQRIKREQNLDLELTLVEQNKNLGGKIATAHRGDFIIETGADSMVARHESVHRLIEQLELEEEVVYNATGISYIYTNNELHPIPEDTVFGIPTSVESLNSSTLVSEEGKKAALKDFETTNESFTSDSSVGSFLEAFLGKELVEKQVAPVLSGVYSGGLDKLTIASTLPYLLEYKNQYGSIIKGLSENKEKFKAGANKKFLSFENGLSTIINKLEDKLTEASIFKGTQTTNVTKKADKYEISFADHDPIEADYVVLAVPHDVAQTLLTNDELDNDFNKLSNSSIITLYLGFDLPDEQLPADGTGFIVSENSDVTCNACTWTSRKWAHTSSKRKLLVRLFYKNSNPAYEELVAMNEEELTQVALKDIEKSLGIKEHAPEVVEVTPWTNLMPNYHLEHGQAVHALNDKLVELYPDVILAGASYYGVGIGACIENGTDTAELIAKKMAERE
ncbi:protoporphyrinogen oxidase [Bacillus tianshenii]|nr:protoporphyrinogen oxidase [Bacillus tianshenii]